MNTSTRHFSTDTVLLQQGALVYLTGELDAYSAVKASTALENIVNDGIDFLLIDCSQLTYISSAGLGVILSVYHLCLQKHTCLTLFSMQARIRNVFEVLGMHKILNLTDNQEEAMAFSSLQRRA